MCRHALSFLLALLLTSAAATNFAFAQPTKKDEKQQAQIATYKQRVVGWGTNKAVNVKLNSNEKVAGRLAEIKDESFTVQAVVNGQVTNRVIRYDEVKKISAQVNAGKIAGYTTLGVLAGVGAIIGIVAIVYAATY